MLLFIQQNLATIIVATILIIALVFAIAKIVKDKKAGKSSCGGSCAGCPMSGQCSKEKK